MPNGINRSQKLKNMSRLDKDLETIDTLADHITLYRIGIRNSLNNITKNPVLQKQILDSLGIDLTLE